MFRVQLVGPNAIAKNTGGVFKSRLVRMIGINATRANVMLKRERLGIALGDGLHAFARRRSAFYARTMREEYYDQAYGRGPPAW